MKKKKKEKFCEHEFETVNLPSEYSENYKKNPYTIFICIKCGKNKKESINEI